MIFPWNPPFLPGFSMAMLNNQMVLLLCAQACPLRTASFLSKDGPSHYSTSPICQSELLEFGKLLPQASTKTGTPLDERNIEKPTPRQSKSYQCARVRMPTLLVFRFCLGFWVSIHNHDWQTMLQEKCHWHGLLQNAHPNIVASPWVLIPLCCWFYHKWSFTSPPAVTFAILSWQCCQ